MRLAHVRGPGQPDQACDLVAASIVEEYLRRDPESRLNIHVTGGRGMLFVSGEVLSQADFDVSMIVRRTLTQAGYVTEIEPFIAFEQLSPSWAPKFGSRELILANGYATRETPSFLSQPVQEARHLARRLEQKRLQHPDWYWLGSDYEVWIRETGSAMQAIVRVQHVETMKIEQVREQIAQLIHETTPQMDVLVNRAGEEHKSGLVERVGSSRRFSSMLSEGGSVLPASGVWSGTHLTQGEQLGHWMCRKAACDLLKQTQGKAVFVEVCWLPFETKPVSFRARNEQGEVLDSFLTLERFSFESVPKSWIEPNIATAVVRYPFDPNGFLPWEDVS